MAKESFFIRTTKNLGNTNAYHQREIDIGAFVDVQGGTILKIHGVQIVWSDDNGRSTNIPDGDTAASQWQLTTQTQSDIVFASDKAVVASGRVIADGTTFAGPVGDHLPSYVGNDFDLDVSVWTNGYLVAVETMYFGGSASTGWHGDQYCTIVLECTTQKMTNKAAMALALSQQ
ncbi:MAG TPA: hypothetical protein EYN66_14420 [Myxococcales bacterium]|nr:hypothetical protein [Myxococcales bacterium]